MAIFAKRPLAACCCLLIGAVVLALLFSSLVGLLLLIGAVALLVGAIILLIWRRSYLALYFTLLALGLTVGALRGTVFVWQTEQMTAHLDKEVSAVFTVEEVSYTNSYSAELTVLVEELAGKSCHGRAILLLDVASPFYRGDRVSGSFRVMPLTHQSYFKNQAYQYKAKGCSVVLACESTEELVLIEHRQNDLITWMESLRIRFGATLKSAIGGEAGELSNAMLLGDRNGLSVTTTRNFKRAGVMHLLALSGLHVGILAGIFDRLLFWFGVHKKIRVSLTVLLMLGYLLLTGCTLSALRAVLMLLLVYLAFFFKSRADALTSLSLVAALMLLWQPFAIFSTSYQLTVLATFGILAFAKVQKLLLSHFPRRKGIRGLPLTLARLTITSLLITLFASMAVLPVQWLTFGEISLMTPISNLLLVPIATPFLIFSLGTLFLFPIAPFALGASACGNLMLFLAAALAKPSSTVSFAYSFVPYLFLPCLILLAIMMIVDLKKRWWLTFAPVLVLTVGFACGVLISNVLTANGITAVYRVSGKNEGLGLFGNEGAVLCDLSSGNQTQLKATWQLLRDEGATELDVLLLTHYHNAQKIAFSRFSESVMVRALWAPQPQNEAEFLIFEAMFEIAEARGITVTVYEYDTALTVFGGGTLTVGAPLYSSRSTEPALSLTLTKGENTLYYESAALSEYRRQKGITAAPVDAEFYILGAHGPVPHDTVSLLPETEGTVLIPNEGVLHLLEISDTATYIPFAEKYRFVLQ